eukprot:CAMPEP_0197250360 /NCGR_PEP_ID=MMETSP1429-20130617/52467_1 /TAXON_ID=49237 /ORGANISM="Chaetoceros  sp., Strain UNC1202" /LENGTH=63 /DNA_ID=CAMNT_0042712169 /DNA_START=41 /DNA_END=228 /DNA_ORIENTATION=-
MTAPSVYSLSLENNITPKVEYLANLWNLPIHKRTTTTTSVKKASKAVTSLSRQLSDYPNVLTL